MIDDVRGFIIGQSLSQGRLFCDGRAQGGAMSAESEADLRQMAEALKSQLLADFGGWPCYLYGDSRLWGLRIYN